MDDSNGLCIDKKTIQLTFNIGLTRGVMAFYCICKHMENNSFFSVKDDFVFKTLIKH